MSVQEFHRRVTDRVRQAIDFNLERLANYQYRHSSIIMDADNRPVGSINGSSTEEAAMYLVERNAAIRAQQATIVILDEVYKQMTVPEEKQEAKPKPQEIY